MESGLKRQGSGCRKWKKICHYAERMQPPLGLVKDRKKMKFTVEEDRQRSTLKDFVHRFTMASEACA